MAVWVFSHDFNSWGHQRKKLHALPGAWRKNLERKGLEEPQIPSLRSLLVKPEDSDPESEIQEEKESVRRNSGKTLRVPLAQRGVCVQKKAHWPARYRSITRVGDRPALRADAPTQRGLRTLQPSARASRREGAYKQLPLASSCVL